MSYPSIFNNSSETSLAGNGYKTYTDMYFNNSTDLPPITTAAVVPTSDNTGLASWFNGYKTYTDMYFNNSTDLPPTTTTAVTPTSDNTGLAGWFNGLLYDGKGNGLLSNLMKHRNTTVNEVDPVTGKITTKTIDGGFMSSDLAQIGKGLYGIGIDAYSIYNANRNAKLQKQQLANTRYKYAKDYSLAATQYNNALTDKENRAAAAAQSGFSVVTPKYKHVSETY